MARRSLRSSVPTRHTTGIERPRCVDRLPSHISKMVVSTVRGGGPNLSQAPGPPFELPIPLDGRPLGKVSDFQSFKYHADLRDEYMGSRWGHASVARRLHEVCPLVEVGVRSLSLASGALSATTRSRSSSGRRPTATVIDALTPAVYVSIDLDVLDPALMPAVGTPEPGGMSWHDLIGLVRAVARERKIVGFDVTELSPGEGPEAGAFTAAKLVQKVIGYSVPAA